MSTRSYTNSRNEVVEVTSEHLDVAVQIKIELQKMSPSMRCSWRQHKKLMEEEGFYDSDTNESYRCMVKDHQGKSGLLPTVHNHSNMVADSKLRSLNNLLGELYSEKRENQLVLQEINKFKRDFHLSKVVAEEIINEFKNFKIEIKDKPDRKHYRDWVYEKTDNEAIVVLTDLHIGAVVDDVYGNYYNFEIAKKRLDAYLDKVIKHCKTFRIHTVRVVGLGDYVEHLYMRHKQSKEAEFSLAQQILKASELIIEFLVRLSRFVNVEYKAIAGNHDRLQGNKDINFDDDNANVIINYNIKTAIQFINSPVLTYFDTEDGATEINEVIHGKKIKLVHGHLDNGNKRERMKSYISMNNEFFDVLIYGHLHHFKIEESDNGRLSIGVGSVKGRDTYSTSLSCATDASQLMLVVSEDGDIIPLRIDLQIV